MTMTSLCLLLLSQAPGGAWVDEIRAPQFVAVAVEDVDQAVSWYTAALGLEQIDDTTAEDDAWRIVNLANEHFFVEIIRDDREARETPGKPQKPWLGFAKVGFRVPDLEVVADRVERATGARPRIVDFVRHGVRIMQLKDPEGNTLQLTSPLDPADSG